ncbi:cytochrome P450 [Astrocystis sublimbata]|nr:cytochrome P450 [Astrocystis sublimbata]
MGLLSVWPEGLVPSVPQLAIGAALYMAYWIASAIYNRFFSQLRKIPGPFLNSVSWIPWYKYWFSGYMHRHVTRLHEEYGPVVRLGPTEISFIDGAAWKDIYSLKRCRQIERDPKSFPALTPNGARFDLLTYSPEGHAKYRKILNPSFSEKSTKEYEPTIQENTDNFIKKLSTKLEQKNVKINLTQWLQWLTFDMVADVVFGTPFSCVSEEKSHPCLALSMDLVSASSFIVFVSWWTGLKNFLVKLSGVENLFINMVRTKCETNLSSKSTKASIFSNLTKAGDPLNQAEIDGNMTALVIAGSETTGFILTATSFYLATNPECFRKAAEEVRSAFSTAEEITDDEIRKLPYLRAATDEALRMTPAEPNGLARKVVIDGIDIANQYIPKETAIYVSQYAQNRQSSNFHLADEYRPERWLNDPEFQNDKLDLVQPFIMGVNVCIGRGLAWMEMRIILAKMLWHFDWTVDVKDREPFEQAKAWHVWTKNPIQINLLPRGALDAKA